MKLSAVTLLVVFLVAGCAGSSDDRLENADAFREKLAQLDYEVELQPRSETHPGLVIGEVSGAGGISSTFAFSFGPAPERLPAELEAAGDVWIDEGDEVNSWIESLPTGVPATDEFLEMRFAIEDAGCEVATGEPCGAS